MSPHRRNCAIRALLEVRGAVSELTLDKLQRMNERELAAVFNEIGAALDGANITEPAGGPRIEDVETIEMPGLDELDD